MPWRSVAASPAARDRIESAWGRQGGLSWWVVVVAVLVVVVAAGCGGTTARSTLAPGDRYVSLGSSFAAGAGIPTVGPTCGRSDHNYPHLVAEALELDLTDVSCSGATTANILQTGQEGEPPQIEAVTSDTDLVTVTVGGNNIDYTLFSVLCGGATVDQHCTADLDEAAVDQKVAQLPAALDATIDAIRDRAPNAVIVIVTPPRVVPADGSTCAALGLTPEDGEYLSRLGQTLQDDLVAAARRNQVLVADSYSRSEGHGPCDPVVDRWMEGANPSQGAVLFHPNANGHVEMARLVIDALEGKLRPSAHPTVVDTQPTTVEPEGPGAQRP